MLTKTKLCLLLLILFTSSVAYAGPIRKAVEAVGDTASAVGESVTNTVDSITGERTPEMVRAEINATEKETLGKLFRQQPAARKLFDRSYGYAVFDSSKKGFMISSASGAGIAVNKSSGDRTYMRMASLGASIGAGIQYFQVIFLFENQKAYNTFVDSGWEAEGAADAVFGKDSLSADLQFVNGKAIFQLNETGLMLGANISGTKYWKDSELNSKG